MKSFSRKESNCVPRVATGIDQFLSAGAVSLAKSLSENELVVRNRAEFLEKWGTKSQKEIKKEIKRIKRRFENKEIGEIDGDFTGPAWQVAALNSLLN